MEISYSQAQSLIKHFKLKEKFVELSQQARDKNTSLSSQGKELGLGDTRDVRRYLRDNKLNDN